MPRATQKLQFVNSSENQDHWSHWTSTDQFRYMWLWNSRTRFKK